MIHQEVTDHFVTVHHVYVTADPPKNLELVETRPTQFDFGALSSRLLD